MSGAAHNDEPRENGRSSLPAPQDGSRRLSPGDTHYEGSIRIKQHDDHYIVHGGSWAGGRYSVHEYLGRHDGFYEIPEPAKKEPEPEPEPPTRTGLPPTHEGLSWAEYHDSMMRDNGQTPGLSGRRKR